MFDKILEMKNVSIIEKNQQQSVKGGNNYPHCIWLDGPDCQPIHMH
ncbi:hypothetical protein [uncultured Aquimarina sp.]|nr:hypothetical protein [uncultured Aquimarina sp.]